MRIRATVAAVAALATISTAAHAQRTTRTSASQPASAQQPIELGMDGQIGIGMSNQGTSISLPVPKIRAGFHLGPAISIEPALGFFRDSNEGSSSSYMLADVSMLYHFSPIRTANQFYVRPVIGFNRLSSSIDTGTGTTSSSVTYTNVGVGGGVKIPVLNRIAARLEGEFRSQLEKEAQPAQNALNLNFGVSVYTR